VGGEAVWEHATAVRLGEAVADRGDGVIEGAGLQRELPGRRYHPIGLDWVLANVGPVVEQRCVPQAAEDLRVSRREVRVDRVRHLVQGHPLDHAGQAEAVIAVEVREADPVDLRGGDAGEQHLPLGALARVEENALGVPLQEVAIVVAGPGGRLARRPQHHQLTSRHEIRA
jgi:hypothetical protein